MFPPETRWRRLVSSRNIGQEHPEKLKIKREKDRGSDLKPQKELGIAEKMRKDFAETSRKNVKTSEKRKVQRTPYAA